MMDKLKVELYDGFRMCVVVFAIAIGVSMALGVVF